MSSCTRHPHLSILSAIHTRPLLFIAILLPSFKFHHCLPFPATHTSPLPSFLSQSYFTIPFMGTPLSSFPCYLQPTIAFLSLPSTAYHCRPFMASPTHPLPSFPHHPYPTIACLSPPFTHNYYLHFCPPTPNHCLPFCSPTPNHCLPFPAIHSSPLQSFPSYLVSTLADSMHTGMDRLFQRHHVLY